MRSFEPEAKHAGTAAPVLLTLQCVALAFKEVNLKSLAFESHRQRREDSCALNATVSESP